MFGFNLAGRRTASASEEASACSPRHTPPPLRFIATTARRCRLSYLLRFACDCDDDDDGEAGLLALRERRMMVTQDDFTKAKEKALYRKKGNIPEGIYL